MNQRKGDQKRMYINRTQEKRGGGERRGSRGKRKNNSVTKKPKSTYSGKTNGLLSLDEKTGKMRRNCPGSIRGGTQKKKRKDPDRKREAIHRREPGTMSEGESVRIARRRKKGGVIRFFDSAPLRRRGKRCTLRAARRKGPENW